MIHNLHRRLSRVRKHRHTPLVAKSSLALFTIAISLLLLGHLMPGTHSNLKTALVPEQVGYGLGVPACISSAPAPYCSGANTSSFDVSFQGNHCTGSDVFMYGRIIDNTSGWVGWDQSFPCSGGSINFTGGFTPGDSYQVIIYGAQSNAYYDQTPSMTAPNCAPPPPAPSSINNDPQGSFDSASCTTIYGWAFDRDSPGSQIQVHLYVDGAAGAGGWFDGGFWTDVYRSDVNAYFPTYGLTGNHGFSFATPANLRDGNPHALYIHAIDTAGGNNPVIGLSPQWIACAPPSWTTYCTGGSDPYGNNWQWWQYDQYGNYQYARPGDGSCTPTAPTITSSSCSAGGTVSYSWTASAGATSYHIDFDPHDASYTCPAYWTKYVPNGHCYVYNYSGTSVSFPGIVGRDYNLNVRAITSDTIHWVDVYSSWASANVSCTSLPAPASMSYSCGTGGTSVTFTWPTATGATSYYPRYSTTLGSCSAGWAMWTDGTTCYKNAIPGTSATASITPGATYSGWVHTGDPVDWSRSAGTPGFSCASLSQPDLTASNVSPTTATGGIATTFSSTISNSGSVSTGAGFQNFFQVATASGGGGSVTDLSSVSLPALGSGSTAPISTSYTFPSSGTYSMRACADKSSSSSAGTIAESNEGNNCSSWSDITVSAGLTGSCLSTGSACTASANSCGMTASTIVDDGLGNGSSSCSCQPVSNSSCTAPTISIQATPSIIASGGSCTLQWNVPIPNPAPSSISCTLKGFGVSDSCTGATCNGIRTKTSPALTASASYTVTCKNGSTVTVTKVAKCTINPTLIEK